MSIELLSPSSVSKLLASQTLSDPISVVTELVYCSLFREASTVCVRVCWSRSFLYIDDDGLSVFSDPLNQEQYSNRERMLWKTLGAVARVELGNKEGKGRWIRVEGMFENVPVRKRKMIMEAEVLNDELVLFFTRLALVTPKLAISFVDESNNRVWFKTNGYSSFVHAFSSLFHEKMGSCMLKMAYPRSIMDISFTAFIVPFDLFHHSSKLQLVYMNNRFVSFLRLVKLINDFFSGFQEAKSSFDRTPLSQKHNFPVFVFFLACPSSYFCLLLGNCIEFTYSSFEEAILKLVAFSLHRFLASRFPIIMNSFAAKCIFSRILDNNLLFLNWKDSFELLDPSDSFFDPRLCIISKSFEPVHICAEKLEIQPCSSKDLAVMQHNSFLVSSQERKIKQFFAECDECFVGVYNSSPKPKHQFQSRSLPALELNFKSRRLNPDETKVRNNTLAIRLFQPKRRQTVTFRENELPVQVSNAELEEYLAMNDLPMQPTNISHQARIKSRYFCDQICVKSDVKCPKSESVPFYPIHTPHVLQKCDLAELAVISQVQKEFILCKNQLFISIIDQHAVHERVQLEKFENEALACGKESSFFRLQSFDPPFKVSVLYEEAVVIQKQSSLFSFWGFEISNVNFVAGQSPFVWLRGLPIVFDTKLEVSDLMEFIASISVPHTQGSFLPSPIFRVLQSRACHSAIKFGNDLNYDQCVNLVKNVSTCNFPFICAHGRPSIITLFSWQPNERQHLVNYLHKLRL